MNNAVPHDGFHHIDHAQINLWMRMLCVTGAQSAAIMCLVHHLEPLPAPDLGLYNESEEMVITLLSGSSLKDALDSLNYKDTDTELDINAAVRKVYHLAAQGTFDPLISETLKERGLKRLCASSVVPEYASLMGSRLESYGFKAELRDTPLGQKTVWAREG